MSGKNGHYALEQLLQKATELHASDLHLVVAEPPVYRVSGQLQRAEGDPLTPEDIKAIVEGQIGAEKAAKIGTELGEATTVCQVPGGPEGRMTVAKAGAAFTVTVRILPSKLPDPGKVRVPQALLDAADSPSGLIIVAGEAGCGKTTVAMMLLEHINSHTARRIVTIEDPVGYCLQPKQAVITQQSVGLDTPSYPSGLRAVLRLDPDVIFVGEVRDLPTLEACVTGAHTGHLVITQIHAISPEDAVQRMIDVHPEEMKPVFRGNLAAVLRAVSVQKLLPRASKPGVVTAFGLLIPDKETRRAIAEGRDLKDRTSPPPAGCQNLADDIRRVQKDGLISDQTANETLSLLEY